jgi:glycine hydroxymethyltransferase
LTPSGIRIGTPALATRGFDDAEFTEVSDIIAQVLKPNADHAALKARVNKLAESVPLYDKLTSPGSWR